VFGVVDRCIRREVPAVVDWGRGSFGSHRERGCGLRVRGVRELPPKRANAVSFAP